MRTQTSPRRRPTGRGSPAPSPALEAAPPGRATTSTVSVIVLLDRARSLVPDVARRDLANDGQLLHTTHGLRPDVAELPLVDVNGEAEARDQGASSHTRLAPLAA